MTKSYAGGVSLPAVYAPEVIKEMHGRLSVSKQEVRTLRRYFAAASHLYGIISLEHLLDIYNRQNSPVSQEDFLAVAEIICHEAHDFCILENKDLYEDAPDTEPLERKIVSLLILSFGLDKYYKVARRQRGKAYAVLDRAKFLAYTDPGFYPATAENLRMLAFLRSRHCRLQGSAREALQHIQTLIWIGCGVQEAMRYLAATGFGFLNRAEKREFFVLFRAMERHTRTAENRGQTPASIQYRRNVFLAAHRRLFAGI